MMMQNMWKMLNLDTDGLIYIALYTICLGVMYRISIKFGSELNLANWRFVTKLPNLNFVNIIFKPWVKQLLK